MKKKITIVVSIFLVLMIVSAAYYFTPKIFGKGVDPLNVDHINVFDGKTGVGFTVDNSKDIQYIVENIQSKLMRRGGVSLGRMGYKFSIVKREPTPENFDEFGQYLLETNKKKGWKK